MRNCRKKAGTCLISSLDIGYDIFTVGLSLTDVISDIIITYEFYQEEDRTFFWLSIASFCIAHSAYSFLFLSEYAFSNSSLQFCGTILAFIVVFPFAQLVPTLLWIDSYEIESLRNCYEYCGLKRDHTRRLEGKDTLNKVIGTMIQKHAGFIIE